MSGLRGDDGWRQHRSKSNTVLNLAPTLDTRPMSEWSHVERDAAGHNSTAIRDAEWWARRRSRWTWHRQRHADVVAVIKARIAPDVTIPETDDAETLLRIVAYHLQAANGPERLLESLDAFCIDWAPWARIGASDILDAVMADVVGRRQDLSAVRAGVELRVTWDERCRLGLRTIRPFDMTNAEFRSAVKARKREKDRAWAEAARRRQGSASWADRSWKAREQPWVALGMSRATYFRRQKAGIAGAITSETVASRIGEASMTYDATVSRDADDAAAVEGRGAAPVSPPAFPAISFSDDSGSRSARKAACARMEDAALDGARAPFGIATPQDQPERSAA